jgi:hypothetical protein
MGSRDSALGGVLAATSGASFRDPAGYVFTQDDIVKRVVTRFGAEEYNRLMTSGLYEELVGKDLLIPHREEQVPADSDVAAVLVPEQIPYISYPYEWSFGQLRDAALLTLEMQDAAMKHGMSLKDASAFNVQFRGSQPVFIDTLSFEENDGGPWVAYGQFCRHFLAPLLLMRHVSPGFNQFWKASLDGFPLDVAAALLPKRTYLSLGTLLHIHLHARSQKKYNATAAPLPKSAAAQTGPDRKPALVDSLKSFVRSIRLPDVETEWVHYYSKGLSHYTNAAEASKKATVAEALDRLKPGTVFDIGGNIGEYSRLATARGAYTVCFDIDPLCVHHNYERARSEHDRLILPLMIDLTNPSPTLGFGLTERDSILERANADVVMALAVLHHLRITGNAPLVRIAAFLARLGEHLIIEYVPKSDVMAQKLLRSRKDTFADYTDAGFQDAFGRCFSTEQVIPVAETARSVYVMKRRG